MLSLSAGAAGVGLGGMGLGASESVNGDDLSELKANVSQLQQQYAHLEVDVINCCKNKSGAAVSPIRAIPY